MDLHSRVAAAGAWPEANVTDGDRKGRTEQIFLEAVGIAADERTAFLEQACGDDAGLRGEVESLLRYHQPGTIGGMLQPAARVRPRGDWTTDSLTVVAEIAARMLGKGWYRALTYLLGVVLLAGVGYWSRHRVQQSLRGQISEQLRVVLNADVTALEIWIAGWKREVDVWAANKDLRHVAERLVRMTLGAPGREAKLRDSPHQKNFAAILGPFLAEAASPEDVVGVLLDRTGIRLAVTPPYLDLVGDRNSERAAGIFVALLEGRTKFIPPSRMDSWAPERPRDPRPVVFVAAPVRTSNGDIFAILALVKLLGPSGFSEILTTARMGASGETYAISPEGLLLSPSRFEEANKKAGLVPDEPGASSVLTVQVRDPGGDLTRGYKPALQLEARPLTMIARLALASRGRPVDQQTGVVLEPYRDYRGVEVLGAWRWLPEHNFAVITEVDAAEAFAPLGSVGRAFEVVFGLLAVFVALTLLASATLGRMRQRNVLLPRLGPYLLLQTIGEGGMGRVYLARHELLRRLTAVKVRNASSTPAQGGNLQFEREAQAASRLTHPNTIEVYDFGRTPEGTFYCAMEYLEGVTLAELVSLDGPTAPGRVIHILIQVCGSLREAHHQGLLHGDVKPSNIMLCERGGQYDYVKVLDFGLVRPLSSVETDRTSSPDRMFGTPLYMAPERFQVACEADARSDIYSMGAVAYHLLAGRPVFQAATNIDLLDQILHAEAERPPGRPSDPIPDGLWQLVMECLAKDPARRPQSAAAVLEVLNVIKETAPWTQQDATDWWVRRAPSLVNPVR